MKSEYTTLFSTASDTLGVKSRAALALFSPSEIQRSIKNTGQECDWPNAQALHTQAKKEYDDLRIMEKKLLIRASPLLPAAVRFGLKHPDVSLQDYEEWFGREAAYVGPGDVSSMFSPAAYLTELYRNACKLYPPSSDWHIDTRRPDLSGLIFSQENMDWEVTSLSLSNEILMERMRNELDEKGEVSDDEIMQALATHLTSSTTPFHLHHARLRQVCLQKDPSYGQLLAAPRVTGLLSGPTMAGIHYDIPPALYHLLTDEITEENAEGKFKKYFGERVDPLSILDPEILRRWYGLTDDELKQINSDVLNFDTYSLDTLNTVIEGNIYRIKLTEFNNNDTLRVYPLSDKTLKIKGVTKFSGKQGYALCPGYTGTNPTIRWKNDQKPYSHNEPFSITIDMKDAQPADKATFKLSGEDSLRVGKWWPGVDQGGLDGEFHRVKWNITPLGSAYVYALRLNKAVRLYKATGLPPRVLEDVVNSISPTQITNETLTLLFRTTLLMKHYSVSHEEALVMSKGKISQVTHGVESSQWDRIFNTPPLTEEGFYPDDNKTIILLPDDPDHADIKATLKRAFCTDDDGMWTLWQIYDSSVSASKLELNLEHISGMYAISLWARALSLSPQELLQLLKMLDLPSELGGRPVQQWNALFVRASATVEWLRARGWTVGDMMLMTRDVAHILPGSEIASLLTSLRTAAFAASLPENPDFGNYALALIPTLAASLNLPGEDLTRALLAWADGAKPGGNTLAEFWTLLVKEEPDQVDTSALTAFAYGLAQMALIVHATGVTAEVLALFVANPARLLAKAGATLARSAEVVMALGQFSEWLRTLPDRGGAGSAVVKSLAADGVTLAVLAQATGLSSTIVEQAAAEAKPRNGRLDDTKLASWPEISLVLEWIKLSQAFGVTPSDIGQLMKLDYLSSSSTTWGDWKRVADTLTAALPAVQRRSAEDIVAVGLSGALSGWLLAQSSLTRLGVSSREALLNFLLSDNLNGPEVKTSRIAEAITSLQIFIHRVLSLSPSDPDSQWVVRDALDGLFFRDWLQWNARFSTWVGGQKLMYYPENYIDPTMRLGQTSMMDDMLQVLGQAQINTDTVGDAFMGYLTGFEEVANLETVSGYHDSENPDEGKTWFVGRSQSDPFEYWWRSVDEGKRSSEGNLPANAWSEWKKITCAPQPFEHLIRPMLYRGRLYLGWIERHHQVISRNENGTENKVTYRWELKMSWYRYDGCWSTPSVYIYPTEMVIKLEGLLNPENGQQDLSFYLSACPARQVMLSGIYKKNPDNVEDFVAEVHIYEDMSFRSNSAISANWTLLKPQLDNTTESCVLIPFRPLDIMVSDKLEPVDSELPGHFSRFEVDNIEPRIISLDEDNSIYKIKLGVTFSAEYKNREYTSWDGFQNFFNFYEDLYDETNPVSVCLGYPNPRLPPKIVVVARKSEGMIFGYIYANFDVSIYDTVRDASFNSDEDRELIRDNNNSLNFFHAKFRLSSDDLSQVTLVYTRKNVTSTQRLGDPSLNARHVKVTPARYKPDYPVIVDVPRSQITCLIKQEGVNDTPIYASGGMNLDDGVSTCSWPAESIYPVSNEKYFTFSGDEVMHDLTIQLKGTYQRTWRLRVYKDNNNEIKVDVIGSLETNGDRAQFLQHGVNRTRLNTLFARQLTERSASGIDAILNYSTQTLPEPPLFRQSAKILLEPYNEAIHGDGSFTVYYAGVNESGSTMDRHAAFSGKLNKDGEPTQVILPLPGIKDKTGHENKVLSIEVIYPHRDQPSPTRKTYNCNYDKDTGTFIEIHDNSRTPVITSAEIVDTAQSVMDFSGANALYFWELFYYTPMMIMQRFLQEERYDLAEKWLKYVFSPSGYLVQGIPERRMWNVRPLNEDTSWNDEPLATYDPDAVAQNDPMHYKLNAFMRLLDIIIGKGDAAYRKLERDTLAEAKVWYGRALSLLGDQPWINPGSGWDNPTLGTAASMQALSDHVDALSLMARRITRISELPVDAITGSKLFLPEANEMIIGYWDTLRIRLYNLRHNLTIDGQPLNLSMFATPADPKALLAAAVTSEGGADSAIPAITVIPALRFTPLLESARSMASQLIQFGSLMQQILLSQDAEALYELLNTQGASLASSSVTLQEQTLRELAAERGTLEKSIDAVMTRRDHYKRLYQENVNAREIHSMSLLTASETMGAAIKPLYVAGAAAGIAPNIFGLANGGMKYDGPLNAMGIGMEIVASGLNIAGSRIQQEEMYRRRREEWDIQYRSAEKEIQGLEAQLSALSVRETSAMMQVAHMKTQSQHATALLEQFQSKFTSKAMYSWLRGRLATIYYQYYDLTASMCLMTEKALQWEKEDLGSYLKTGTWTGAWAGLMAGEGLMLSLAQMEMAWMKHQKRELEVTRTVSLAAFFDGRLGDDSLTSAISKLLKGSTESVGEGDNKLVYDTKDGLAIHFRLKDLDVAPDYSESKARVRSISVTLPALLGPYQNVKARLRTTASGLPAGCNECAISQALYDNGLFNNDGSGDPRWGARWLPFEGLPLKDESGMTLTFANAKEDQLALLESLSDVILHIQFSVR